MNRRPGSLFEGSALGLALVCLLTPLDAPATSDGYEVAARYPVVLEDASAVVVGNGSIGCLVSSPQESIGFLDARVNGEHWQMGESSSDSKPRPAIRVPLASFSVRVRNAMESQESVLRFSRGATYSLCDGVVSNRWETGLGVLAADLTVAPTQNLILFSLASDYPLDVTLSLSLGGGVTASTSAIEFGTRESDGAIVGVTRNLPEWESYGIGVAVAGNAVSAATTENGGVLQVSGARSFVCRILFVEPEEGIPLLTSTLRETRCVSATGEAELRDGFLDWWYTFWNRSVLDLAGSDEEDSILLERAWVRAHHALATHSRGSYPPCDSGFWMLGSEGRVWHPTLWLIYGGWALSGHGADIRCLSYPLLLDFEGDTRDQHQPFEPLLPLESGPDGIPSDVEESLDRTISEVEFLGALFHWDPQGSAFSSLPLLAWLLLDEKVSGYRVDALYPFLRANANRSAEILEANGETPVPDSLILHLLAAIDVARELAQRIGVDLKSRQQWEACLERVESDQWDLGTSPCRLILSTETDGGPDRGELQAFLRWLASQSYTPEGLVLAESGVPSLLKTGAILQKILGLLADDDEGVLRILPGIPMMGSWSAGVERISVPNGLRVVSLPMRNGLVDSFLLRSTRGGPCSLQLPLGWSSAQVVRIGEIHEPVEFDMVEPTTPNAQQVITFPAQEGDDFLVGPIW